MKCYVKFLPKAEKFIFSLDKSVREIILKKVEGLQKNPIPKNKKHILDVIDSKYLCEFCFGKWRLYYVFEDGEIVIESVLYDGVLSFVDGSSSHKSGNKKNWSNQRKYIALLRKEFKNKKIG